MFLLVVSPGFSSCSRRRIASSPRGVAAFPRPRRLAVIFMHIAWKAFPFMSSPLKRRLRNGLNNADKESVSFAFSATRIRPPHMHIPPSRYKNRFTASTQELSAASPTRGIFPVNAPKTADTISISANIHFIICFTPYYCFLQPKFPLRVQFIKNLDKGNNC